MKPTRKVAFDPTKFLAKAADKLSTVVYGKKKPIFSQGAAADAIYYIHEGKVKLSVVSKSGKAAVVGILGPGDFFGEGCLAGQTVRMSSASAMSECSITRLAKTNVIKMLHSDPSFSERFLAYVLSRNIRIEEDLIDQLFNSSEKRLARLLLLLANFGKEGRTEPVIPSISHETLAGMIGTTRSRVSFFMNKFRKLGLIEYSDRLEVRSALLNVVLHD